MLIVLSGAMAAGCDVDSSALAPLRLRHSPPVAQLTALQLRSLAMECEQYAPNDSMRGRYDASYCELAIAAWGDSPLQMVVIPPAPATRP